jgi:hypothetical protein
MAKKTTRKAARPAFRKVKKPSAARAAFHAGKRRPAGRNDGYPPFITADDLIPQQPERFKILPSITLFQRTDGTASLFVQVTRKNGEMFTLGVNAGSPDRIALQQQIGRNLLDWPGKVITLHSVRGTRGGQFVNVYDPAREDQRLGSAVPATDDDIPF